jgi:hypothetical protein
LTFDLLRNFKSPRLIQHVNCHESTLFAYRVWKNRQRGTTLNVWENDFNNTITGYADWNYPEFKGCFSRVGWLQLDTTEGPLTAILGENSPTFVQVLTPEFPPEKLQEKTRVTLPQAGLAFLQAIPPIGDKFHLASDSGPQGQPTEASGSYSDRINFFFGPLPAETVNPPVSP